MTLIIKGRHVTGSGGGTTVNGLTELLLHAENFSDSSAYPKDITNYSTSVSSSQQKFGSNSFQFYGYSWLSVENYFSFWMDEDDFLVESFIYFTTLPSSGEQQIMGQWGQYGYSWRLTLQTDNKIILAVNSDGGSTQVFVVSSAISWNLNQWYHLAVSRKGNTCRIFLDGSVVASNDVSSFTWIKPSSSLVLQIGRNGDNAWYFKGYMEEIRVIRGYGVDTMTVPTSPYS